jgi:hypothetical protein
MQEPLTSTAHNNIDTCMISGASNLTNNVIHFIPETYQYSVISLPGLTPNDVFA